MEFFVGICWLLVLVIVENPLLNIDLVYVRLDSIIAFLHYSLVSLISIPLASIFNISIDITRG